MSGGNGSGAIISNTLAKGLKGLSNTAPDQPWPLQELSDRARDGTVSPAQASRTTLGLARWIELRDAGGRVDKLHWKDGMLEEFATQDLELG